MTHPFANHRQSKVEHSRVSHITKGYAAGGAVHDDAAEDRALLRKSVKKSALKMEGKASGGRADRACRARGGRAPKSGKTNVNVIIAPQGGDKGPMMPPPVAGLAGPPPGPPAGPVPPPMRPGMGAPPPGVMPPPPMGPRANGGRTYAKGGGVNAGTKVFEEGKRLGTQVTHAPGKNDGKDLGRGKPVTYASGGPINAPVKGGMGPKLEGGARGGHARLEKAARAKRDYARPAT